MENFKHLPEPFRIRVIEPVKRTSREYREQAILKSGMNPLNILWRISQNDKIKDDKFDF